MVTLGYVPSKGDIVWLNFTPQAGQEQRGCRPALVVSSQIYNRNGLMLACPITSKVKNYPFEVPLKVEHIEGAVLADHVKNQDWRVREVKFIARASKEVLQETQQIIALLLAK
jgi:mRNA interferase MazF